MSEMKDCWASHLGSCNGALTKEHIISNSILNNKIYVKGLSWCRDKPKEVSASSFTSKILCEKHNNALSAFDSEAKQYVSVIDDFCKKNIDFHRFGFRKSRIPVIHKVDGIKLERWCSKTLINVCLCQKDKPIISFDRILPIIFQDGNYEEPYGLNFAVSIGQYVNTADDFQIVPLLNESNDKKKELSGGLITFRGIRLILLLPCSRQNVLVNNELQLNLSKEIEESWVGSQLNWHNKSILYKKPQGRKNYLMQRIDFKW